MDRATAIAATCSVALHLAALALSQYLFDGTTSPSISNRVLVIDVKLPPQASQTIEGEALVDDGMRSDSPSARVTEAREVAATPDVAVSVSEPVAELPDAAPDDADAEVAAAADVQADDPPRAEARSDSVPDREQSVRDDAQTPGITAEREQDVVVARVDTRDDVPEAEPVSPGQERMLNRKLRKLTQSHDRLEKMDGTLWKHEGQEYVAKVTAVPASGDQTIEQVIVEVSTESGGKRLSTEMRMRRLAFSNYAQFVNRWDPNVGLHDDELDGRFHSNSEISLADDRRTTPKFHGKVTTAAHSVNYGDRPGYVRRSAIFLGGLETGVRSIPFPQRYVPFPADAGAGEDRVRYFAEDVRITFDADGSYRWRAIASGSEERSAEISAESTYLIAAAKAELHVEGTVNGKVLLYSPERIVVESNLVYAQDPATTPEADDYLGLVSDKYVEIAAPDVTGPGDLTVHAAIYAKRGFTVKGYGARGGALLDIYGSLTAGSISATEPRYRTRIRFDPRLEKLRPPAFPMTDRYEIESWDGVWREAARDVR